MSKTQKNFAFPLIILSLIIIPLAVYWQATGYPFVWDDNELYINQTHFPKDNQFANILKFWSPTKKEMYIPLTYTVWSFAAKIGGYYPTDKSGFNPEPFHLFNILAHCINGLLVFLILYELLKKHWFALFGALFFVLHPIQVEAVAWISEFRGLLGTMFGFLAIYNFIKLRQSEANLSIQQDKVKQNKTKSTITKTNRNSKAMLFLTIVFVLLSMLSKPSGVVFPIMILLIDVFHFKTKYKESLISFGIMFLFAIPIAIIANAQESKFAVDFAARFWQKPFVFFDTIIFYLRDIIFPLNLSACYGRTPSFLYASPWFYISTIAVLIIVGIFYITRKKSKPFILPELIFIVGYLPVSGLMTFNYQYWSTVADRYLYPSFLGISMGFALILGNFKKERSAYTFSIIYLIILTYITLTQIPVWGSEIALWSNAIDKYPENSGHPYNARGYVYLENKEYGKAMQDFDKSISLNPIESSVYYNRGNIYLDLQEYGKALDDFTKSIELRSNYPDAYVNRGLTFDGLGKYGEAIDDFTKAIELQPNQSDIYDDRGVEYAKSGNMKKAIEDFKTAFKINPNDKQAMEYLKQAEGK